MLLGLGRELEVEVAVRIGDEAAAEEHAAQIGDGTAVLLHEPARDGVERRVVLVQDAELGQRRGETLLVHDRDQVVVRLVQHGASHGEFGREVEHRAQQLDDLAGHRCGLGGDLETHAAAAGVMERSLNAHERRELGARAARLGVLHAGELLFHLGGEGHHHTSASAANSRSASWRIGSAWSARSAASARMPSASMRASTSGPPVTCRTRPRCESAESTSTTSIRPVRPWRSEGLNVVGRVHPVRLAAQVSDVADVNHRGIAFGDRPGDAFHEEVRDHARE